MVVAEGLGAPNKLMMSLTAIDCFEARELVAAVAEGEDAWDSEVEEKTSESKSATLPRLLGLTEVTLECTFVESIESKSSRRLEVVGEAVAEVLRRPVPAKVLWAGFEGDEMSLRSF